MAVVPPFFAADVGNSRIKIGCFAGGADWQPVEGTGLPAGAALPQPDATIQLAAFTANDRATSRDHLRAWLAGRPAAPDTRWVVASVNRSHAEWLREEVASAGSAPSDVVLLQHGDLPIDVHVDVPQRVGLDRLLGAVAANRLRNRDQPAIVIDIGTAITVDLVSAEGAFEGGAILPGIAMAARALEAQTDALPCSSLTELVEPPAAVGKSTVAAIESGLLWGTVGALHELVARMADMDDRPPQVFATGGMSPAVVPMLQSSRFPLVHVPDLVLGGIAIVAQKESPWPGP